MRDSTRELSNSLEPHAGEARPRRERMPAIYRPG